MILAQPQQLVVFRFGARLGGFLQGGAFLLQLLVFRAQGGQRGVLLLAGGVNPAQPGQQPHHT